MLVMLAFMSAELAVVSGADAGGASDASCVAEGLGRPRVIEAAMTHPGDHYTQTILLELAPTELTAECDERFEVALPHYKFELQDHLHHSHWMALDPLRAATHSPRRHGTLWAYWGIQKGHGKKKPMAKWRLYQCSPGSSVTKVRALLRLRVVDLASRKTAGEKAVEVPVTVKPVKAKLKHRGALRGPC